MYVCVGVSLRDSIVHKTIESFDRQCIVCKCFHLCVVRARACVCALMRGLYMAYTLRCLLHVHDRSIVNLHLLCVSMSVDGYGCIFLCVWVTSVSFVFPGRECLCACVSVCRLSGDFGGLVLPRLTWIGGVRGIPPVSHGTASDVKHFQTHVLHMTLLRHTHTHARLELP